MCMSNAKSAFLAMRIRIAVSPLVRVVLGAPRRVSQHTVRGTRGAKTHSVNILDNALRPSDESGQPVPSAVHDQ